MRRAGSRRPSYLAAALLALAACAIYVAGLYVLVVVVGGAGGDAGAVLFAGVRVLAPAGIASLLAVARRAP